MSKGKAAAIGSGRHATVEALLDAYHAAASRADIQSYFGCMHRLGRFVGTDSTENWSSEEFHDFCLPYFASGQGWTYVPVSSSRKFGYFPGPSAQGAQFCTFDELLHNDSFGTCRGTGTLVYDADLSSWFIAAYHLSFPVPNDAAREVTALIKKNDSTLKEKQADAAAAQLLAELELEESADKKTGGGKSSKKKKGKN